MTTTQARAYIHIVKDCFDSYWFGSQGITTLKFLEGLQDYIDWKEKHRFHSIRTLKHDEGSPQGYNQEI